MRSRKRPNRWQETGDARRMAPAKSLLKISFSPDIRLVYSTSFVMVTIPRSRTMTYRVLSSEGTECIRALILCHQLSPA